MPVTGWKGIHYRGQLERNVWIIVYVKSVRVILVAECTLKGEMDPEQDFNGLEKNQGILIGSKTL
jgi:hypothetical protein